MKKVLFTILANMLFVLAFAQGNGGIANENNILKLTYLGWLNGEHKMTLQNKANCEVTVTMNMAGTMSDIVIPALTTINLNHTATQSTNVSIKSKRKTGASCVAQPDNGWVEIATTGIVLPIKFKSIIGKRINSNTIQLTFEVEEDTDLDNYVIKVSNDGKTFRQVAMIFPNGLIASKKYIVTINL
jgi:hypothetical protein